MYEKTLEVCCFVSCTLPKLFSLPLAQYICLHVHNILNFDTDFFPLKQSDRRGEVSCGHGEAPVEGKRRNLNDSVDSKSLTKSSFVKLRLT